MAMRQGGWVGGWGQAKFTSARATRFQETLVFRRLAPPTPVFYGIIDKVTVKRVKQLALLAEDSPAAAVCAGDPCV